MQVHSFCIRTTEKCRNDARVVRCCLADNGPAGDWRWHAAVTGFPLAPHPGSASTLTNGRR